MIRSESARAALLGISVVDALRGEAVTGLRAWAWSARFDSAVARGLELSRVRAASPGLGGVLAWHDLPSYAGWSRREQLRSAAEPHAYTRRDHTIVVVDPTARLHPLCAEQPVPGPIADEATRPELLRLLTLRAYPTATHPPPDGVVVVRARLWDPTQDVAAAWALLHVTVEGQTFSGLAGEDGQVAVFVPVPRVRGGVGLAKQSWSIAVDASYAGLHPRLRSDGPHPLTGLRIVPPTAMTIEAQPTVQVYSTAAATPSDRFVPPRLPAFGELCLAPPQPSAALLEDRTCLFVTP